jgi:hypothetical protein
MAMGAECRTPAETVPCQSLPSELRRWLPTTTRSTCSSSARCSKPALYQDAPRVRTRDVAYSGRKVTAQDALDFWMALSKFHREAKSKPAKLLRRPINVRHHDLARPDPAQFGGPTHRSIGRAGKIRSDHDAQRTLAACPGAEDFGAARDQHRNAGPLHGSLRDTSKQPLGAGAPAQGPDDDEPCPRCSGSHKLLVGNSDAHHFLHRHRQLAQALGLGLQRTFDRADARGLLMALLFAQGVRFAHVHELHGLVEPRGKRGSHESSIGSVGGKIGAANDGHWILLWPCRSRMGCPYPNRRGSYQVFDGSVDASQRTHET